MANSVIGTIESVLVDGRGCFIRLRDPSPNVIPLYGNFLLEAGHTAYQFLYPLVLVSLANNLRILINTKSDIDPAAFGQVENLVVNS